MNENINTFRALKDLPLVVTSFWCRFNWHTWTKWGDVVSSNSSSWTRQHRNCIHCNSIEIKKWRE